MKNINDKLIKGNTNPYLDETGNLNNENNPFIIANQNNLKKKVENDTNQINCEDELDKDINTTNWDNKCSIYNNKEEIILKKNSNIIDYSKCKILNIRNFEFNDDDKIIEKGNNNIWYKKFKYLEKSYYQMTKYKVALKSDHIIYYCNLHNTIIGSEKFNEKGRKTPIRKCNSRIIYNKDTMIYCLETEHSESCLNISKQFYSNTADINKQINNYKQFREELYNYLDINPIVKYQEFKEKAIKLYKKNNCCFTIKENTFKNIYYNWRRSSNLHSKFAIFKWKYTLDNNEYLREYKFSLIYNKTGKKLLSHEHIIYCSNFFIRKLQNADHWYIDGTWIYPKGFRQLIIILYYDKSSKKRYPGLYALINNKTFEGYLELFKKILSIITIENSKSLKLKSYTTDFEQALINCLSILIPNVRSIGCYYHYYVNIYKNAKKYKLNNDNILNDLYLLPYKLINDIEIFEKFKSKYNNKKYIEFMDYINSQWGKYFRNGMLNYSNTTKNIRSNSYIENYNRRIKLKLSNYLYGKNKCLISWPLFLYFIINEEKEYRLNIYNNETSLEQKYNDFNNIKDFKNENIINEKKNDFLNQTTFLRWNYNSCRYDTFFFLYYFQLYKEIKNINNYDNQNINIINNIVEEISDLDMFNNNISVWELLKKYKTDNFNVTTSNSLYKQFNSFIQTIKLLEKEGLFCIKYHTLEGCSNCKLPISKENFYIPYIEYSELDLVNKISLDNKISNILVNSYSTCLECGYDTNHEVIINKNSYYTIITEKIYPKYLFVVFEFISDNSEEFPNYLEQELHNFNKRIQYNNEIIEFITEDKIINNREYKLIGIVTTPTNDHYTCLICNLDNDIQNLKKGNNYYYDDRWGIPNIKQIDNFIECLKKNNPYIALYKRV